jgi:PhnB protein
MKLHTYLNFGGNCLEAFRFYEQNLGGKITMSMTYADQPDAPSVPPEQAKNILYAHLLLGETSLMGSDTSNYAPMRSAYLSLSVDSNEEAERIYKLLSEGGEVFMPMGETFFAYRFGMARDRFGVSWMILNPRPNPNA